MQPNSLASMKPSPEEAQKVLEAFWINVSHGRMVKTMSMLQTHPWILQQRVPEKLSAWKGMPFLQAAIHLIQPDLVAYGISHGAPLEHKCPKGNTALQSLIASLVDSASFIQAPKDNPLYPLIGKFIDADANCCVLNASTENPLWFDARHFPIDIVEKLIQAGSPIEFGEIDRRSGLAIVLSCGLMSDQATMLVRNGADVNFYHPILIETSPLAYALDYENMAMAEFLCENGTNIHFQDNSMRGFLHVAKNPSAVAWLMARGLNLEAKDNAGTTPLLHALKGLIFSLKEDSEYGRNLHQEVARTMISAGANVHAKTFDNASLTAAEIITAHKDRVPDLYNVLLAVNAREAAAQTIKEIARMAP